MSSQQISAALRSNSLFITCFAALVATSFCFVLRAFVIDDWGLLGTLVTVFAGGYWTLYIGTFVWPMALQIVLIAAIGLYSLSVALLPLVMLVAYLSLILHFRRRGGYRAVALQSAQSR